MVAHFTRAFKMREETQSSWYDSRLKVEIKEIDDQEAQNILERNANELKDKQGNEISREDAIFNIKQGILIFVAAYLDYSILDENAFDMAIVLEKDKNI